MGSALNRLESIIRNFTGRGASSRRRLRTVSGIVGRVPAAVAVENLEERLLLTIDIVFDYTYDSTGFLNPQGRRDVLEAVASVYEARITDDLTAIAPSGTNTWTAVFNNPSTNGQVNLSNLQVPANTIIVYVGGRDLTSGLGLGGPGGFSASASPAFVQNLQTRGETGVDPTGTTDTDYSLWGGTISFDNASTWNFSLDPPTTGQNDFYSVALHELGHVLGLGTADSFENKINSSKQFIGTESVASFGGPIPMNTDQFGNLDSGHFAPNTASTLPGTSTTQEVALDPNLTTGTRKHLTDLDWAALDDLGWDITAVAGPTDYGDAPDATAGTGAGNYQTRIADNGPSHAIVNGLRIGATVDGDDGNQQNSTATADDTTGSDDEDFSLSASLYLVEGAAGTIQVNVTNTLASAATLYGWVDFNANGVFETSERASVTVPAGTNDGTVSLNFAASAVGSAGSTFARFRLSTDTAAASPTGAAANGEVEDHSITILTQATAYDSLPSFNWASAAGAVRYELELNNLSTGQSQVILQSELKTTSFRPAEALPAGVYSWRYRPHNGTSFLPFSDPISFAIFETTGNPIITDPVGSSIDSRPTIAWSPVATATRYELWVNGGAKERIVHQSSLTSTSFTPITGLPADTYTAWVRAFNGSAALGTWSSAVSFTLANSGTSVLTDPVAGSTNTAPTFAWLPMNAASYVLEVDNLTTSTVNVIQATGLTGTSFTPKTALPAGSYAGYITGEGFARSAPVYFQVLEVTGQAQFTVPSAKSENPLPIFSWTSVTGANRYELWVDDVVNGIARVIHSSGLTDTVFAATDALPSSSYRAWVRAFNGTTAIGTWSTPLEFTVADSIAVPTIWAPVDLSLNTAPTFVWSTVSGASHYELDIRLNGTLLQTQQFITDNTFSLEESLAAVSGYASTVRAYNGTALLGTANRSFNLATSTGAIELYSPAAQTDSTRPTISWTSVDTATRYIVWVNDDTRAINATILQNNVQSPSFTPQSAMLPGNYRVWVRAYNGASPVSSWTFARKFTIQETNSTPAITAPVHNTTNSVPTITWTAVTDAASYQIEIDDVTNSQTAFMTAQGITTTTFRPTNPLVPGLYRVRVRSVNGAGTLSSWSSDFNLTILAASNATMVSPLPGASTAAANALFAWTTVSGAIRYELWVNNQSTGTNKFIYETSLTDISFTPASQLPAGNYRAWVRAIHSGGTPGTWSSGIDFTIASTSANAEVESEGEIGINGRAVDLEIQLAGINAPEFTANKVVPAEMAQQDSATEPTVAAESERPAENQVAVLVQSQQQTTPDAVWAEMIDQLLGDSLKTLGDV